MAQPPVKPASGAARQLGLEADGPALAVTVLPLWPGTPPGETDTLPPESDQPPQPNAKPVRRIQHVSQPELHWYAVPGATKAVLIAPGGGYNILAWDLEGTEIAQWLNQQGISAGVLKYRVPRRKADDRNQAPLVAKMDALRGLRLIRAQMPPMAKVGMLGFSAGGHLTVTTCTNPEAKLYEPIDAVDQRSARPDFAVLIYPAYLLDPKNPNQLRPELPVTAETPPMFLAHAYDDPVTPESSLQLALALKRAKVPCELHLYRDGGHGFGLRASSSESASWTDRCAAWLRKL
jgi:acetyl esterase/lipase